MDNGWNMSRPEFIHCICYIRAGHYIILVSCNWYQSQGTTFDPPVPSWQIQLCFWDLQIRLYSRYSFPGQTRKHEDVIWILLCTLPHFFLPLFWPSQNTSSPLCCTPSYLLTSAVFLLVGAFGRYTDLGMIASCPERSTSHHSSCFHTTILFSGAFERSHAASLIKVPHMPYWSWSSFAASSIIKKQSVYFGFWEINWDPMRKKSN